MKPTLFLLAAGMGSRYGGLKQLDGLGPNGETIMDYSIYDAIKAGFTKVVFIIKEENYEIFVKTQDLSGLMAAYQEALVNQDQQVRVLEPGHEYTGVARGINAMGELLVEKEDGTITEVYAGEVSVRGLYGYV